MFHMSTNIPQSAIERALSGDNRRDKASTVVILFGYFYDARIGGLGAAVVGDRQHESKGFFAVRGLNEGFTALESDNATVVPSLWVHLNRGMP